MSGDANGPVDWAAIDTVLLDMDGTLLDLNFDNFFWQQYVPQRYSESVGLGLAEAMEELVPRFKAAEGSLDWYCLDFWSRELDLDILALKREVADRVAIRPHVLEFLEALRVAGKTILLATNAHIDTLNIKMERSQLADHFDALITSHSFGLAKEQPGFWDAVRARHPFDPARSLFVDDSLPVLAAAKDYGLNVLAIRQPDSKQPRRQIDDFLAIDHFDEILPIG